MREFQLFIIKNGLKKQDVANFLGVSRTWLSQLYNGEKDLSDKHLYKILHNDKGWDISMFFKQNPEAVNSVINSENFTYEQGINAELIGIIREQQRQMGELILTISRLTPLLKDKTI